MVRDLLASKSSSCKKNLENFSKFWVFDFWQLIFATHSWVASSSRGICDSLASGSPSREKDLEKIFKILFKGFWWLSLVTHSWVSWVAKIVFSAQIGLKLIQFFKNFSVSLASCVFLFVFSASPSLKTAIFTPKTSIFIFNLHSKSKKMYGFSLLFTLFQV